MNLHTSKERNWGWRPRVALGPGAPGSRSSWPRAPTGHGAASTGRPRSQGSSLGVRTSKPSPHMALEGPRRHPVRTSGPPACPLVRRPRATPRLGHGVRPRGAPDHVPRTPPHPQPKEAPTRGKRTRLVPRAGGPRQFTRTREGGQVRVMQAGVQVLGGASRLRLPRPVPPLNPKAAGDGGAAGGQVPAWPGEAAPGRIARPAQDSQTWAAPGGKEAVLREPAGTKGPRRLSHSHTCAPPTEG